jgi:hypothetical protein
MPRLKNPRWEKFCQCYVSKDMYGNGQNSYVEAFNKKPKSQMDWAVVRSHASTLLRNGNIVKRINELLDTEGWNDVNADKQALFMLNQHADLKVKLGVYKEYNAIKRRIAAPQVNLTLNKYEQFLSVNVSGGKEVLDSPQETGVQLPNVQKSLPENKNEGFEADLLQSKQGAGDVGIQNEITGKDEEAYKGICFESETGGDND